MADQAKWRIVLCDLLGQELQVITTVAAAKRFSFKLKKPWSFTFTADASDPRIAGTHADGWPYLSKLRRTIKALRLENGVYVPKFTGVVWQTHVQVADSASVAVSCFDVMKRLDRRRVFNSGSYDLLVQFGAGSPDAVDALITDGIQIAKTIVQRTITIEGAIGISLDPGLGAVFESAPATVARWERKKVAPALMELADTFNGFDFRFQPVDRVDGTLAVMQAYSRIGSYKPSAMLAWDVPPHTAASMEWMDDGETVANAITAVGGGENAAGHLTSAQTSAPSISAIGQYSDVSVYNSILLQELLDDLALEEINFRAYGKETVMSVPVAPPKGPFPWDDFDLGDFVYVAASARAKGGFSGAQRVWGFDVAVSDEDVETCEAIYTSPQ